MICTSLQIFDRIKNNEVGGAYSTCRGQEKFTKGFGGEV